MIIMLGRLDALFVVVVAVAVATLASTAINDTAAKIKAAAKGATERVNGLVIINR